MKEYSYLGDELTIFEQARHWKSYFESLLRPFLIGKVLEVGAGIGATTKVLNNPSIEYWVCLEPDPEFIAIMTAKISLGELPESCFPFQGNIRDLENQVFNTILYIDVLEHISDDRRELADAYSHLESGGHLIILSPAHSWLFTPFDQAIGHFRRYSKKNLTEIIPAGLIKIQLHYLDSMGMLLSLSNRYLLHQSQPTLRQIQFWDRWVIPLSRKIDLITGFTLGKTILGIWKKTD